MKKLLSSLIVLIITTTAFISCDKAEEIQKEVCEDAVNQRALIEKATVSFKVNLIDSPIDNRKVKISMQKQYCDGHFPNPVLFERNTTGAGFCSGQGFFKLENALDKIIISIEIETSDQDGEYIVMETTLYYDSFNSIMPVITLKCTEYETLIYQGWAP